MYDRSQLFVKRNEQLGETIMDTNEGEKMEKTEEFMKPKLTFAKELRMSPYAWAKLIWFRDRGNTEVAGYCITNTEDPLLVNDFVLVKQKCTMVTFELDPEDSIEYMEKMIDGGLPPWAYSNILAHTHPGEDTNPSIIDEENFNKAFSHPNWAIMLIVGKDGSTYCRLKMNTGPGALSLLDVVIDYGVPFNGSNPIAWAKEYEEKVFKKTFLMTGSEGIERHLVPKDKARISELNQVSATTQQIADMDQCYADQSGSGNSSLWWDDEEAAYISVTPEEIQQREFEEELDEMDCYWDIDGEVICWISHMGEDCAYYYNPDTNQWQIDSDDGFKVCSAPEQEGLAMRIRSWAKKNEYCRPVMGNVII